MVSDDEYVVRYIDLPLGTRALVSIDETGFANIYINAKLSAEEQKEQARHEIDHVLHDDAYNDDDIRTVEGR